MDAKQRMVIIVGPPEAQFKVLYLHSCITHKTLLVEIKERSHIVKFDGSSCWFGPSVALYSQHRSKLF